MSKALKRLTKTVFSPRAQEKEKKTKRFYRESKSLGRSQHTGHVLLGPEQPDLLLLVLVGLHALKQLQKSEKKRNQKEKSCQILTMTTCQIFRRFQKIPNLKGIVKDRGGRVQGEPVVRRDLRLAPAALLRIVLDLQHVVGEGLAEDQLVVGQPGLGLGGADHRQLLGLSEEEEEKRVRKMGDWTFEESWYVNVGGQQPDGGAVERGSRQGGLGGQEAEGHDRLWVNEERRRRRRRRSGWDRGKKKRKVIQSF